MSANESPDQETVMLRAAVANLAREVLELRQRLAVFTKQPEGYTLDVFLMQLYARLGRVYGWKDAYVTASRVQGCQLVTQHMISLWQRQNRVPAWAVQQLDSMQFDRRARRESTPIDWSESETQFLLAMHIGDPSVSNAELASRCTDKFGRSITESAIKGKLDRARKAQQAPQFQGRRKPKHVVELVH